MMKRHRLPPLLLCLAFVVAGCAPLLTKGPDSALFPRDGPPTCTSPQPGLAMLRVPDRVLSAVGEPFARQRQQIGQIASQAFLRALNECWKDGGIMVAEPLPLGIEGTATLSIEDLSFEQKGHIVWLVPIPVPFMPGAIGQSEIRTRLTLEIKLLDPQGRTVWTRSYSDDLGRLKHSEWEPQALIEGPTRLAHEASWRLAQRAVHDLREWIDARRQDERDL
jgi:hypothetical protein